MDTRPAEYSQSGLHAPYPAFNGVSEPPSEASSADPASAAQYPPQPSATATPTSEYGLNPSSARSGTFPDYLTRQPYPEGHPRFQQQPSSSSGGMAQASSPSLPLADGQHHPAGQPHPSHPGAHRGIKSDPEVPIDPSIAASSPTYPPPGGQYSPYPPQQQHDMAQAYQQGHAGGAGAIYGRPGPEWGQYGPAHPQHGVPPYSQQHASPSTTVSSASSAAPAGGRPGQVGHPAQPHPLQSPVYRRQSHPHSQVYSFVPIPGSQQHKRPRRRYEEIERMYKCGWNGCEKAYGTLNHLNAHVTMQSHGQKRTPEEFKEIRKEWKARKKEEDNARKADEERQRVAAQANQVEPQAGADPAQASSAAAYPPGVRPQLPPIGYTPGAQAGQVQQGHYPAQPNGIEQMQQYSNNPLYSNYPQSPYGQGNQMYQQRQTPLLGDPETDADAEPDPDVPSGNYQQ
ncbi:MAG: hypothetical protein M1832_000568 [Thelocarpon impressellum]|nr:MAG: hypothetical protein M1832_000568 [Thelocarpon impressellum]